MAEDDKKPKPQWSTRRITRLFRSIIYLAFVALISTAGYIAYLASTAPDFSDLASRPPERLAIVLDRHGEEIGRRGDRPIIPINIEIIPDHVLSAILVVEDRRFFEHAGVDWTAILRAAWANASEGHIVQGGSTITQQLAKNLFLSPDRTMERKVHEIALALQLERRFTKTEILEFYLNRVYFGSGAWGIEAAARTYFGKSASQLTLGEAALLAGLLQAPSRYSPRADRLRAQTRAAMVLDAMLEQNAITQAEHRAALATPVIVRRATQDEVAGHFVDWVVDEAWRTLPEPTGAIIITTTLDLPMQRAALSALNQGLDDPRYHGIEGAMIALDGDGAVRVLIGARNYVNSQFNRALHAKRQPGSAFKPIVYAAALEAGLTPQTLALDEPISIDGWSPQNFDNRHRGAVTLATALAASINTIAVRTAEQIGRERVITMADRLGLDAKLGNTPAVALGVYEVTLLDITSVYAAFANTGFRVEPYAITRITVANADRTMLQDNAPPTPVRAITQTHADALDLMLGGVIERGTGTNAKLPGHQTGGKTGTSDEYRDAWFIGYVPGFAAGVWIGHDDGASMDSIVGGQAPARIWRTFMSDIMDE